MKKNVFKVIYLYNTFGHSSYQDLQPEEIHQQQRQLRALISSLGWWGVGSPGKLDKAFAPWGLVRIWGEGRGV
jgi:hypothetical protein